LIHEGTERSDRQKSSPQPETNRKKTASRLEAKITSSIGFCLKLAYPPDRGENAKKFVIKMAYCPFSLMRAHVPHHLSDSRHGRNRLEVFVLWTFVAIILENQKPTLGSMQRAR